MIKIPHRISAIAALSLSLGAAILMTACDVFENDVKPNKPTSGNEVYMLKNTNAYIDVNARVNTNGEISVDISQAPQKGTVTAVASGLLKYSPFESFTEGQDVFKYSVFNASHELLATDSVIIIVEDDTTHLPCGLYAHDDWANADTIELIEIPVLANDVLCGDSADIKLEIFTPSGSPQPHHGTAYVSDGRIWYTPTDNGPFQDSLFYKLSLISSPTVTAYATVFINVTSPSDTCQFTAWDDDYSVNHTISSDTLYLDVLHNDHLCDSALSLTIIEPPQHGDAIVLFVSDFELGVRYAYSPPTPPAIINDSLRYEVCTQNGCRTATVKLKIF
jgi:hypothetical protein